MDNICHTLVGAALAEAGLKKRTALGSATLMIGANFPDIDVIAVPLGHSLAFRRGLTHGVPAHIILPVILTAIMLAWWRWRGRRGEAPRPRELLLLSAIGISTHPFLDWMNTYGMRWLMPIEPTWSYADTLFIADPWIWLALLGGVWWSRQRERSGHRSFTTPARVALSAVAAYIALMGALTAIARGVVREALMARGITADTVVVEPVAVNPVKRRVIYLLEDVYYLADYGLLTASLSDPWHSIALNARHPAVAVANQTSRGREYHSWTRLPYYVVEEGADTTWVTLADVRYTLDARSTWAVYRIPVTSGASAGPRTGVGAE